MADIPAISGVDDPANVRVVLIQGKQQVNAPLTGLGFLPLDGSVPMSGDLDMGTHNIGNATDITAFHLRGTSTASNSLTVNDQPLMLGDIAGLNLIASRSGLVARNNGVASNLNLNTLGGNVTLGNTTSTVILNGSQLQFANANNSANTATLDGYTDWIAYTPTFTGFGTVSGVSIWSKRVGDSLMIRGKFTSGTSTAVEARMTLGFNGTNANVTSDITKIASIQLAGPLVPSFAAANAYYVLIESNIGYITFSVQSAGNAGLTKALGTVMAASGNVLSFTAEVPITGW